MKSKTSLKNNIGILMIILIFLLLSLTLINFYNDTWWDSAVYIGMGKFIYSSGNAGFWEPARPIILPLLLGFLWKIGLNPVIFGKILALLFGAGCIYLTYLIGKKIFDERIALISALFLAFTPIFLFFGSKILSEIPSLFFMLLSVYFFISKRFFLTGLFAGTAFLTRFLQLFAFFAIFILFLFCFKKEKSFFLKLLYILIGFLIAIIPYLIFNYFMYQTILYPFSLQLFLTKNTGWVFYEPFWFYFANLFKENFLLLFSIPGFAFIFKKPNYKKFLILFCFFIFFIFFSIIGHKEERFMLIFLPYLYILASYGIFAVFGKIKNKKVIFAFFLLIFLIWLTQTAIQIKNNYDGELKKTNEYAPFQNYLKKDIKGDIWITNPLFVVYSDKKIAELMYYPTFNHNKLIFLKSNVKNAEHILINTCDLYCEPYNKFCERDKIELINFLRNKFNVIFYEKEKYCEYYIFSK